jgi:hypothetical protein
MVEYQDITWQEAKERLGAMIQARGVTIKCAKLLARDDDAWKDSKGALHFQCTLGAASLKQPLGPYTWSCGSGIPETRAKEGPAPFHIRQAAREMKACRPGTLDHVRARETIAAWYPGPEPLDLISSLLLDASGSDQSFEHWAADFGLDTDSRKAFTAWEACGKVAQDMRRLFGAEYDTAVSLAQAL